MYNKFNVFIHILKIHGKLLNISVLLQFIRFINNPSIIMLIIHNSHKSGHNEISKLNIDLL